MSIARSRLTSWIIILLAWLVLNQAGVTYTQASEKLKYKGRKYVLESYKDLFGNRPVGQSRRMLFEKYLQQSDEGKLRAARCSTRKAEAVWHTLTPEEKTTFLAITAALGSIENEAGINLLEWVESLEEVHGENKFSDGRRFDNNEAFRIYTKLQPAAVSHIAQGKGQFRSICTKRSFGYDGLGTRHPDFCRPQHKFEHQRSVDNFPHLHFNFTESSGCVDIDIDYERGLLHLTRDNSNVLADEHWRTFNKQYCDPGFRSD
ncbi:MAG: hypothetical protein DMG05_19835 [Acidobacteria bacterium]|nr:MAG: hypothetical protein DMG05_19835 [Acidobacteriota bacterium]